MRKAKSILLSLLMALSILLGCVPYALADDTGAIRDILYYYGQHQADAKTDIIRLVESLSPENKEKWRKILTFWHNAYEDQDNVLQLPDSLPKDETLCIIVMGYRLYADGSMRKELIGRLETALSVLEQYPNAYILCTGGGTASDNPGITEADAMAKWLRKQGVAEEKIIVENRAWSTEDNAMNSFKILSDRYPDVDTVVLVSSDYHLTRCKVLFYAQIVLKGLEDGYTIGGWAGYEAGHEGAENPLNDAESMAPMVGLIIDKHYVPELSELMEIIVEGNDNCMIGDPPPIAVSACYSSGYFRDVTKDAVVTGFDSSLAGMQEVTVSYTENGITFSETRKVTVIPLPTEAAQPSVPTTTAPAVSETKAPELSPSKTDKPVLLLAGSMGLSVCAIGTLIIILRKRR